MLHVLGYIALTIGIILALFLICIPLAVYVDKYIDWIESKLN